MLVIGRRAHGEQRRRPIPVMGETFYKGEWMEAGDDPELSPTVFLIPLRHRRFASLRRIGRRALGEPVHHAR
jgi:hypothetical protein